MDNSQLILARQIIERTDTNLFLTGKAGTGKTTFLRRLRCDVPKRMIVLAPTGIAAINAEGMTIHSFFQLPFVPYIPGMNYKQENTFKVNKQKIKLIKSLDLLVIDEISMVRADLLDAVDDSLRKIRRSSEPFGGVQLLLIGDMQQLPPVVNDETWNMLRQYYATPYFFSSLALQRTHYAVIELEKVYRQNDEQFITLLNKIREGDISNQVLSEINKRYIPGFCPAKEEGYVRLMTHNVQVNQINTQELQQLSGNQYQYRAEVSGNFPNSGFPTDEVLSLKKGAQIMFIKNDTHKEYFNGMIGEVVDINEQGFTVQPRENPNQRIEVNQEEWTNVHYALNKETNEITEVVDGTFSQFPVKLAWAITVHKSQGLTFDRVIIDVSNSFSHGQTYVALSRCKTLQGIVLSKPIPPSAIISDQSILSFTKEMKEKDVSEKKLKSMEQIYLQHLVDDLFDFEKERVALASITRLFEEFLWNTYPKMTEALKNEIQGFDLGMMSVSSKFQQQYSRIISDSDFSITDALFQERIHKAADYFMAKLSALTEVLGRTDLMIDNGEVKRRLTTYRQDASAQLHYHIQLLKGVLADGFRIETYLKLKTKLLLEMEGKSGSEGKHKETSKNNAAKKLSLPEEVQNEVLYYRISEWRNRKSKELDVPAYTILRNKSIMAIANYLPRDSKALLQIPYVGAKCLTQYGVEILDMVAQYEEDMAHGKVSRKEVEEKKERIVEKTHEKSLRLYKEGNSPSEISKIRSLTMETVLGHLMKYVASGEVQFEDLVPPEHYRRIKRYVEEHPLTEGQHLTDLKNALGEEISYSDLRLSLERIGQLHS